MTKDAHKCSQGSMKENPMTDHSPSIVVVTVFIANTLTQVQTFSCTLGRTEPTLVAGGNRVQSCGSKRGEQSVNRDKTTKTHDQLAYLVLRYMMLSPKVHSSVLFSLSFCVNEDRIVEFACAYRI